MRRRTLYIAVALFLLAFIPRVLALDAFLTPDERRWTERSAGFGRALVEGEWAGTLQKGHPGVTTMWTGTAGLLAKYLVGYVIEGSGTGFLDFLREVPIEAVSVDYLAALRAPTALLTSLGVVVVYLLVRKLFEERVALLGAVLLALDPFYLAHSRFLHHDALVTTFMTWAVLSYLVYLYAGRSRPALYLIFSGLAAGLAFLSKSTSLFLIPFIGLLSLAACWTERKALPRRAAQFLLWGAMAGAVFVLLWPAMWVDPAGAIGEVIQKGTSTVSTRYHPQGTFFLGRPTLLNEVLFYPLTLLFRLTPLTLAGLAAACYYLAFRPKPLAWPRNRALIWLGIYALLFALFIGQGGIRYDRYLLPIYPALEIVAAAGLYTLFRVASSSLKFIATEGTEFTEVRAKSLCVLCVLCGSILVLQAAFALPHGPYYLTYYNPMAGGGWLAPQTVLVGWGEGLDRAADYLNAQEEKGLAATWYYSEFSPFYQGETMPLREVEEGQIMPWLGADYVVSYVSQVQSEVPFAAMTRYFRSLKPERTVRLKGIDYAWIYRRPQVPYEVVPARQVRIVPLGRNIVFLGYDLFTDQIAEGRIQVHLFWRCLRPMEERYIIYLKLVNGVYHIWGQQGGMPVFGGLPTDRWTAGMTLRDERELEILPGTPPGVYQIEVSLYDPDRQQSPEPDDGAPLLLGPVEVPKREPPTEEELGIEHPLQATLGDRVRLLGYSLGSGINNELFRPGDGIHLTLFWQALEKMDEGYIVFTHLVDEEGRLWGQKDNEPVDGFYPTTEWEAGEVVRDQYDLPISPDAPAGRYGLEVGMYLADNGRRLSVGETDRVLLEVVTVER